METRREQSSEIHCGTVSLDKDKYLTPAPRASHESQYTRYLAYSYATLSCTLSHKRNIDFGKQKNTTPTRDDRDGTIKDPRCPRHCMSYASLEQLAQVHCCAFRVIVNIWIHFKILFFSKHENKCIYIKFLVGNKNGILAENKF